MTKKHRRRAQPTRLARPDTTAQTDKTQTSRKQSKERRPAIPRLCFGRVLGLLALSIFLAILGFPVLSVVLVLLVGWGGLWWGWMVVVVRRVCVRWEGVASRRRYRRIRKTNTTNQAKTANSDKTDKTSKTNTTDEATKINNSA